METFAQYELFGARGSRIIQGYYFSKPVLVDEVTRLLRIGRIAPLLPDAVG